MHTPRLILAALLLAAPPLIARQAQGQPADAKAAAGQAAQPQQAPKPPDEAFRITITFKTTEKGKTTTQRSYALAATAGDRNSRLGVRDDSHISGMGEPSGLTPPYVNTDVDMGEFKFAGNSVYLALRISTDDFVDNPAAQPPNTHPIIRSRQYSVTPTLPIGKLITVYSAVDAVNDAKVEIQVLVQPLDAK
jgi:hypothetical protein